MIDFYYRLVKAEKLSIEQVPSKYRQKVIDRLEAEHES